jgi:hypothetical protein
MARAVAEFKTDDEPNRLHITGLDVKRIIGTRRPVTTMKIARSG